MRNSPEKSRCSVVGVDEPNPRVCQPLFEGHAAQLQQVFVGVDGVALRIGKEDADGCRRAKRPEAFLALPPRLLRLLALGFISHCPDQGYCSPIFVADQRTAIAGPEVFAVLVFPAILNLGH
jgi:hypothetical protein